MSFAFNFIFFWFGAKNSDLLQYIHLYDLRPLFSIFRVSKKVPRPFKYCAPTGPKGPS